MGCMIQKTMKEKITKECSVCRNFFEKQSTCSRKSWSKRITCSRNCNNKYWVGKTNARKKQGSKNSVPAWNKGIPQSEEAKRNLSEKLKVIAKEKNFGRWMEGKKLSLETRRKQSEAAKAVIARGEHNFYIDGRTPDNKLQRHSLNYKIWREAIFKRDNWTCQECKLRGVRLEAHHIKSFSLFPELRFAIDNGITVCTLCHAKIDSLRARTLTKQI